MKLSLRGYAHSLRKDHCYSWGIFVLRLIVGVAFMLHGASKIQNPMAWMGPDAPVPGILQALAALSEFGGGLAWILGLLTPLASFGILCTMLVAASVHMQKGDGMVGGYELALVYAAVALLILLNGPGKFSLDHLFLRNKN